MRKLTKEQFIAKATAIHGEKYSYENAVYENYDKRLEITCPKHGSFWQTPGNHLKGKGCPYCNGNARKTTEEFIKDARKIWGNRFDYSKVNYINNETEVCIIDSDGKEYWQKPANHLSGFDCSRYKLKTNEEYVKLFNEIHNGKYSYEKMNVVDSKTKITITCPIHGDFEQLLHNHLKGEGCPECNKKSILEDTTNDLLTKHKIKFQSQKKFKWLGRKSLDFFLPKFSLAIECQGKQHIRENGLWEGLNVLAKRDNDKFNICKEHGISIVYVVNDKEKSLTDFYTDKQVLRLSELEDFLKKL